MTSEREDKIEALQNKLLHKLLHSEAVLCLVTKMTEKVLALDDPEGRDLTLASDHIENSLTVLCQVLAALRRVATAPIGETHLILPDQHHCEELVRALAHLRPVVPLIRPQQEGENRSLRPLVPPIRPRHEEDDEESISSVETVTERPASVTEDEEHNLSDTDSDLFGTNTE
jgi:hypothetical protein